MKLRYSIEVYEHGVLVCAPPGHDGVPMEALSEVSPLFKRDPAVIAFGLPHHYNASRHPTHVCFALAKSKVAAGKWEQQINAELAGIADPAERWYRGTDTGSSSLAIYHALMRPQRNLDQCHTPSDEHDFGRCQRLLNAIPGWRERLPEVAETYRHTKWPAIIERWKELEAADPRAIHAILMSL